MDLSVVVVTYNSRDHIAGCLRSLDRARGTLEMEVLVVDNASADGTLDEVRATAPWARIVEMGENCGYARAVNRGTRESTGEFVVALNPDLVAGEDSFVKLHAWMRAHPRCGIAGPRLSDAGGEVEISGRSFPDFSVFLFNRYSLTTWLWPRNPWSRRYLLLDWDRTTDREVDWISGSCLFVRRAAIEEVGGMDEAYFMFNEDVDWCHAMKEKGWTTCYVAGASVMHRIGSSRRRVSSRVILERHRGMVHYLRKYHPSNPLLEALAGALIMLRARLMLLANAVRR